MKTAGTMIWTDSIFLSFFILSDATGWWTQEFRTDLVEQTEKDLLYINENSEALL